MVAPSGFEWVQTGNVGTTPEQNRLYRTITQGANAVSLTSILAGEKNTASATDGYLDTGTLGLTPVVLSGTAALPVVAGIVGINGGADGTVGDSRLCKVIILKNAGPATLTVSGMKDQTGTVQNFVLNGSTADDRIFDFGAGLVNTGQRMQLTPSVTLTSIVSTRPAGA